MDSHDFSEEGIAAMYATCVAGGDRFGTRQLQHVLKSFGLETLCETELVEMLNYLDHDGDGVVSCEDFVTVMTDYLARIRAGSPPPPSRGLPSISEADEDLDGSVVAERTREKLKSDLRGLLSSQDADNLDEMLQLIDAYIARRADAEVHSATISRTEQERRRIEVLQRENAMLADECTRLECDAARAPTLQRRLDEALQEISSLQTQNEILSMDLARVTDSERLLRSQVERHGARATQEAERRAADETTIRDILRTVELERDRLANDLDVVRRDRALLQSACDVLTEENRRHEQSMLREEQARVEARQLHDTIDELRHLLRSRDEQIDFMRASNDESSPVHAGSRPSILNEIEDLVMSQMRGMPGISPMHLSFPTPLTDSAVHSGEPSTDGSQTSLFASPRTALAASTPSLSSSTTARTTPFATPMAVPPTPARAATTTTTATHPRGMNASTSLSAAERARSPDESVLLVCKNDLESLVEPDKLDECMRLFAASSQHLTGRKIATKEITSTMDDATLIETRTVLRELVRARLERLKEALEERDRLSHELEVKQGIIVPVIGLVRAGSVATPQVFPRDHSSPIPPSSAPPRGTPSGTPDEPATTPTSRPSRWRFWSSTTAPAPSTTTPTPPPPRLAVAGGEVRV